MILSSFTPQVGLEPTTLRLTAECSAIELLRHVVGLTNEYYYTKDESGCQVISDIFAEFTKLSVTAQRPPESKVKKHVNSSGEKSAA